MYVARRFRSCQIIPITQVGGVACEARRDREISLRDPWQERLRMSARRVEGLLSERTEDEILVVRESTMEAHALNQAAAIVYDLSDEATSRGAIVAKVARRSAPTPPPTPTPMPPG